MNAKTAFDLIFRNARTRTSAIPVDIGVRHQVDIWMTYHPDARSIRRVAFFIDWLRTLFEAKRYPFFGDDFIHPRDINNLTAPAEAQTLLNLPILNPARRAQSR